MTQASAEPVLLVGQEVELRVYALAYGGEGIAKHQGVVVFIPDLFPGDVARVRIQQVKKRFARAEVTALLVPSPDRVEPFCPLADACGGCNWQHLAYPAQLKAKQSFVENALQHLGRFKSQPVNFPHKAAPLTGYRHKIQIPLQQGPDGLAGGFFARQTHAIVPMEQCPVQPAIGNRLYKAFVELARQHGLQGYDESTHQGDIRHLIIRVGLHTHEVLAMIVTRVPEVPALNAIAQELQQRIPELVGVVQNLNPDKTNVILGHGNKTLIGRPFLYEEIRGLRYRISAESFFQVNPHQLPHLADAVLTAAGLTGKELVADLFCGVGFLTLELARHARLVFGVENVGAAAADAEFNKHLNSFTNTEFMAADAGYALEQLAHKNFRPDVVVLDPPRKGCEPTLMRKLAEMKIKRIVYVSCNPVTLARDLQILAASGYWLQSVQPVDLFPHTYHIESVASLVLKK